MSRKPFMMEDIATLGSPLEPATGASKGSRWSLPATAVALQESDSPWDGLVETCEVRGDWALPTRVTRPYPARGRRTGHLGCHL